MPIVPPELFQFCGPTYLAESPVIDAQRSINLYPVTAYKSSKTQMGLVGRPGLVLFGAGGAATVGHSLWAGEGRLFAALGDSVYEFNNAGGITTTFGPGAGPGLAAATAVPCPIVSNNQQLLVCDPLNGRVFYINPGTGNLGVAVFNGIALEYLDGYMISIATGASLVGANPNQLNVSDFLAAGTAANWGALNYVIRTGSADKLKQLAVMGSLLILFGEKSIEFWYNAGNANFPFARMQGASLNLGCLAAQSVVKFYNTVLWLGADDRGYAQVYMMQGTNPVRVSNASIEFLIAAFSSQPNLPYAKAYGYQEAGHTFYVLNLCNSSYQTSQSLVYDLTTGLWHERSYNVSGPWPCGFASVANFGAVIPNFVCDDLSGNVYYQSINYANDNNATTRKIVYTRTAPHVCDQGKVLRYNRLEIDGDFGNADPILTYSNNGGRSFTSSPSYSMLQATDQGFTGQTFKRAWARQLGRSRDRVFKVTITEGTELIRIANAYLDVS